MTAPGGLDTLGHALRLRDQGWRGLLPILPYDATPSLKLSPEKAEELVKGRGKGPGCYLGNGQWVALSDWRNYPDDEATISAWARWPGVNVGLRAGYADSGVVLLDADVLDPAAAGEVGTMIRQKIGLDALVRLGRAPKALFPVRVRGSLRKLRSTVVLIDGQRTMLEVLAEGQQGVIAGIHPGTQRPYTWPLGGLEDIGPEDLPELTATEIGELCAKASAILLRHGPAVGRNRSGLMAGSRQAKPIEELRARNVELAVDAARFVENRDWTYDDWVSWAYALRGAFGDKGRKLWLGFSRQSDKHASDADAEKVWRDATRAEREGWLHSGAGTIFVIARDEGWTAPLRAIEGPGPHYQAEEIEASAAAGRLRTAVDATIKAARSWSPAAGPAPQTALRTAAGLGKSTAVLDALEALIEQKPGWEPEVWYFTPTVRLAEELADKARERDLAVEVVRGREAVVGGEPLCQKHEEAGIVARAGHPVMSMLCRVKNDRGEELRCPFYDGCRYLRQFKPDRPALRIFAHEYLFLPLPSGLPKPGLIVVDEAFALRAARHTSFGLDRLTTPRTGIKIEHEAEIRDVATRVRDRLEKGEDPRGVADAETLTRLAQLEAGIEGEAFVWPSMTWAEQKRRLAKLQRSERFKLSSFWRVLARHEERTGPLQQVELRRNEPAAEGELQDRVHAWWRASLRLPEAPVLLLDASLNEHLARKLFPRIEVQTIAARRNAEVTQVLDTPCSRNRLLSFEGAPEAEKARAANRLQDVRHLAEVEASKGRKVLAVTYKPAAERLGSIQGVDLAHFGSLRGIDRYKDHDTIIIIGREQPPPATIEGLARSLFGDDEEALVLGVGFRAEVRGFRLRNGDRRGVEVACHPDPRCQTILEQIRERETEQVMDRLRLIHRDRPARVILLSNVVVDATIDRLTTWHALVPSRLEVAAAKLGGVVPLAPAWLARRFPDLWATIEAARCEVKRAGLMGQTPNRESYLGNDPLTAASYRVAGQRGPHPSRALIDPAQASPEAALAVLVGPLAMFQRDPAPATPEPAKDAAPAAVVVAPCARCGEATAAPGLCESCAWIATPPVPAAAPAPPRRLLRQAGGWT